MERTLGKQRLWLLLQLIAPRDLILPLCWFVSIAASLAALEAYKARPGEMVAAPGQSQAAPSCPRERCGFCCSPTLFVRARGQPCTSCDCWSSRPPRGPWLRL